MTEQRRCKNCGKVIEYISLLKRWHHPESMNVRCGNDLTPIAEPDTEGESK